MEKKPAFQDFLTRIRRITADRLHRLRQHYALLRRRVRQRLHVDLAFEREDATAILPWILGLMVFLAALFMHAVLLFQQFSSDKKGWLEETATIQIPAGLPDPQSVQKNILTRLENTDGITFIRVYNQEEMANLLQPWITDPALLQALPVPTAIDITLSDPQDFDMNGLREALTALAPGLTVEGYRHWLEQFRLFLTQISGLSLAVMLFILASIAAILVMTTRVSMQLHQDTINLLHYSGAHDAYIARQFEAHTLMLALKGLGIGLSAAGVMILLIRLALAGVESELLLSIEPGRMFAPIALLVALLVLGLAHFTARRTVLARLAKMV